MNARCAIDGGPPETTAPARVVDLDRRRIERALAGRSRYKYVQPRVEPMTPGDGWKIVSPNCSRNVDPDGGEIDIAAFEPDGAGRWRLLSRDHAAGTWVLKDEGLTLPQALALVCADTDREFWS